MQTAGAVVLLPFSLPVTLLSRGFHKHTLLSLYILLSLALSLFHNLFFSVKAHCQDMVISSTMPVQARSFCSNGLDGKHTVRAESAFECLPRSSLKSM